MKYIRCLFVWLLLLSLALPACAETAEPLPAQTLYSFYDGSVFVGDSITRQLRTYIQEQKEKDQPVPDITFLTAQSYMLYTASRRNLLDSKANIMYKGENQPLCRIIGKIKPEKMFILLGVNDYAGEEIEKHIGYCERILTLMEEFSPDTAVYFFSLTPLTRSFSSSRRRDLRTCWDEYNAALEKMCQEKGAFYIDIATPLKDAEGYLPKEYSNDKQYHLSDKGLQIWLDTLLAYAKGQYDQGLWTPQMP